MIRATLGAVPKRLPVLWAKLAVYLAVCFVTAAAAFASFVGGQHLLGVRGTTLSAPGALRAVFGAALYLTVIGAFSMGVGFALPSTAGGIATVFGVLMVLPGIARALPSTWQNHIVPYLPSEAGGALYTVRPEAHALAPWTGFAVFCAWAAAAIRAGAWALRRRDALPRPRDQPEANPCRPPTRPPSPRPPPAAGASPTLRRRSSPSASASWRSAPGLGLGVVGRHGGGPIQGWDNRVQAWEIHHRAGLVGVSKVIAFLGDAPKLAVIAVALTLVLLAAIRTVRSVIPVAAYLGGEFQVFVIRQIIHRPRPATAVYPHPGAVPGVHETSFSYPSGHAVAVTAVLVAGLGAIALARRAGWLWAVAGAASLFVLDTRLVLGVHWFSDVAFGFVLGAGWGVAVAVGAHRVDWADLAAWLPRNRRREPPLAAATAAGRRQSSPDGPR